MDQQREMLRREAPRKERWRADAKCFGEDTDFFFPEKGLGQTVRRYCSDCPVKAECLNYALTENITVGWWGGYSDREIMRMRRNIRRVR